ncbi:MAG: efflux RND transporter permease subunit [Fimbriimonadaceae bacterium]|nr:efflux RND transporter permease subunit [Fimbriimonadaceae bacterium]
MNIAKFSVSRPVAVTMRIAALVLLGLVCFTRLPIDLLPRVQIPTVAVSVGWPNTSPEEMETQVARPIEQAVSTVPGLDMVSSNSSLGSAFVRVQFDYGVDIDAAAIDVMQAVQRAKRAFPNDPTLSEPTVFKFDPSTLPILMYGVSGEPDLVKLRDMMNTEVSPILESAGGVAQVNVGGGQDRAILVDVDPAKLQAFRLSIADVSRRLREENISLPAGITREGNTEYGIRAIGYFQSIDDLKNVPLGNRDGRLITLSQVADVRDASQEARSFTSMDGEPALVVTITKQSDANTVSTAENVKEKVAELQQRYPNLKFKAAYDQSRFIESSISDLEETAIIGAVLAILIITFFLRNLRSTFVVALSIPTSIISTFALLYFCGFTINTISLSGLALATGLIVDDAIVVLENIYRHIERDGKRRAEAAVSGAQEIMSAVFASTFTVMIVFMPLLLIKGQAGQTFTQFALVVVFSLAISLLDATTVVPMLASRLVHEEEVIEEAHPELREAHGHKPNALTRVFDRIGVWLQRLDHSYRNGLQWAIRKRVAVVGIAVGSVALALMLWPMVGREQLPQTDSGDLSVRVRLPIGTALSVTKRTMKEIEGILIADRDVETVIVGAGTGVSVRGAGGGGSSNEGSATVKLKAARSAKTEDVVKRLQAKLGKVPGVRAQVSPYDVVANILGGNNTGMSVEIYGPDLQVLPKVAEQVRAAMDGIPGLENVDVSVQEASPELHWSVDRDKAQTLGVSFSDIAATLSASTSGQLSSYYQENGYQYPIYVEVPEALRRTTEQLMRLPVVNSEKRGEPVLLGQVAKPEVGVGPNQISRNNRQRYISVGGRIAERAESEVQADVESALSTVTMPEGYRWSFGQRELKRKEEFSGLGLAVLLAIALIYMLLASQFESFIYPLVVLTSVPLCSIGLVLALFLTDRAFGLTAFIGLLMLVGIVVKNGILLVDYTNQLRARGMPRDEAILTAGPTRLRPILMTTLAASLGMLPLAIGLGSGSEMYTPLATAVVGGLITSTMLTLFVVPSVYTFFDDLARRFTKIDRDVARPTLVEPSVSAAERLAGSGVGPEEP